MEFIDRVHMWFFRQLGMNWLDTIVTYFEKLYLSLSLEKRGHDADLLFLHKLNGLMNCAELLALFYIKN